MLTRFSYATGHWSSEGCLMMGAHWPRGRLQSAYKFSMIWDGERGEGTASSALTMSRVSFAPLRQAPLKIRTRSEWESLRSPSLSMGWYTRARGPRIGISGTWVGGGHRCHPLWVLYNLPCDNEKVGLKQCHLGYSFGYCLLLRLSSVGSDIFKLPSRIGFTTAAGSYFSSCSKSLVGRFSASRFTRKKSRVG